MSEYERGFGTHSSQLSIDETSLFMIGWENARTQCFCTIAAGHAISDDNDDG